VKIMNTEKPNYRKKAMIAKRISKLEKKLLQEEKNDTFFEEEIDEESFHYSEEELESEEESEEELEEEKISEMRKKGKKPVDKEKFYVEPKQFDEEIVKYYESGNMSDELALMVSKIAHKLSYAPNFINYTFREEMVGDGIIRMFKALMSKKYDREKGTNPFSYFTRIAFNAFRNRIKKEKHIRDTHEKYQNELILFSENYNTLVRNNQSKILKERLDRY
jgi:hypothetical protein